MYEVNYEFYKNEFGGILSEDEFRVSSRKAVIIVDNMTFGRFNQLNMDEVDDVLKEKINFCICDVTDKVNSSMVEGTMASGIKSSESVDNWSVSFASGTLPKSVTASFKSSVELYLGGTYLLCAWC